MTPTSWLFTLTCVTLRCRRSLSYSRACHCSWLADLPPDERSGVGFLMAVFRKRLASSFAAFQKSLERRRDLIAAIQRDLSDVDERLQQQQKLFEEDEEEDDETDVSLVMARERQRLLRW